MKIRATDSPDTTNSKFAPQKNGWQSGRLPLPFLLH